MPMLSFFSFSVVAGAMTVGKPDYGSTLKQLPSDKPVAIVKGANGGQLACSITQSQANGLAARWRTGWTTMTYDSRDWRTLWVDGPNDRQLRDFLGGSAANCRLVREKSIFYLPFNANLS